MRKINKNQIYHDGKLSTHGAVTDFDVQRNYVIFCRSNFCASLEAQIYKRFRLILNFFVFSEFFLFLFNMGWKLSLRVKLCWFNKVSNIVWEMKIGFRVGNKENFLFSQLSILLWAWVERIRFCDAIICSILLSMKTRLRLHQAMKTRLCLHQDFSSLAPFEHSEQVSS